MQLTIHQESVLPAQDTSVASVISYAIHNHSSVPLITELEISPNGIDYAKDSTLTIEPQTMKVAVPLRFLRWMRLRLYTTEGESGTADVYYQAQSLGCQEEEQ
ncbi:DUF6385 domain-containing protein [Paenibacillus sp. SC116]|uniref:DUF6385 domain-containing protein n=1 Tax=Paenibacillus sp. SC116 TaxID=2968986 RepID=UPI00215B5B34|nr:DUF6385 domain-containing protein [Paenibacillus sp. SC116]MCR8845126.1 DUF6385 domain-containing protein [Paenibacillus sp. SC116]